MDVRKIQLEDIGMNLLDLYIDEFQHHCNARLVFLDKDERKLKEECKKVEFFC